MLRKIKYLLNLLNRLPHLEHLMTEQKILAGKSLINTFDYTQDLPITSYEFKVFSQWGDDGIIQYLINRVDLPNKTFIEFGTENYTESNTRFLLINNNWTGFLMDGSPANIEAIKSSELYWKYDLTATYAFVNQENINELIRGSGFAADVGILSVDIDGNDYWVWEAITGIEPVIVIAEYNSVFGINKPWTIPYRTDFNRTAAHHSNLYFGSSLLSLCDLAEKKGYYFVGSNSAGNNAYFVRKDRIGPVKTVSPEDGYIASKFRESRNAQGELSYIKGDARLNLLEGMPVFNTRTGLQETI
jgi:hypothetical protein